MLTLYRFLSLKMQTVAASYAGSALFADVSVMLVVLCCRGSQEGHPNCAAESRWHLEPQVHRGDSCQRLWPALLCSQVHRYITHMSAWLAFADGIKLRKISLILPWSSAHCMQFQPAVFNCLMLLSHFVALNRHAFWSQPYIAVFYLAVTLRMWLPR